MQMLVSSMLSIFLMSPINTQPHPNIWKNIKGSWAFIGEVKEKPQILVWIQKNKKTPTNDVFIKEIEKMPFISIQPAGGKVIDLEPLQ